MRPVVIAFAGEKSRQRMTELLTAEGFFVLDTCGSGAEVLRQGHRLLGGVVLSGYKLCDMTAEELFYDLPEGVTMALLAKPMELEYCECEDIFRIAAPTTRSELVDTIQMLLGQAEQLYPSPDRSEDQRQLIAQAKELLMARNLMTEEEAHRFLQKRSMDEGSKMVDVAMRVLDGQFLLK